MKKHIPNFITSLNLLSGCLSIAMAFAGYQYLMIASVFIFTGAVFDFLDGFVARALKSYSELGKQLDSLSDLVTFGIAPSVIVLQLLNMSIGKADSSNIIIGMLGQMAGSGISNSYATYTIVELLVVFSSFIIAIFSALRLAKFNIDVRQTSSFIGLPTPANALLFASFPFIVAHGGSFAHVVTNTWFLIVVVLVQSFLLVSEIPLFSLKMKSLKWSDNKTRFIFIGITLVLIMLFAVRAIPLVIITYILLSVVSNALCKKKQSNL